MVKGRGTYEDDRYDCEDHDSMALSHGRGSLDSGISSLENTGVFLFEV